MLLIAINVTIGILEASYSKECAERIANSHELSFVLIPECLRDKNMETFSKLFTRKINRIAAVKLLKPLN